ncbi:hypothetical protein SAMN05216261_2377 [Algibacter luteus]|uniref:Uncharacterized protein n=1 Tax=Algibacter luteus TaxID=1178825 RepID=A0A1M6FG32_9FLAO|nr:hypothetical protein SAMN05216261_2377 [Algibacter luteus]
MVFVYKIKYMLISLQKVVLLSTFVQQLDTNNTFTRVFQNNVVILPLHNAHWITLFNLKR